MSALRNLLLNHPYYQITISKALHEVWTCYGEQSQVIDCARLITILEEIIKEHPDEKRGQFLRSLQNEEQVFVFF